MNQTTTPASAVPAATDYAANLAFFLLEKTNSVLGQWAGKMSAAEQRQLMGRFIGKGTIIINGDNETVCNRVKIAFGQDWDDRNVTTFAALNLIADSNSGPYIEQPAFKTALDAALQAVSEMAGLNEIKGRSGRRFLLAAA